MENNEITVGIKTFLRPKRLEKCLNSLVDKGFKEVIAVDNGIITEFKKKIYNNAESRLPLKLIKVDFDSGVGYITNVIVSEFKTPYLFIIDDDMEITNINPLKEILEENDEIGGVTGQLLDKNKLVLEAYNLYLIDKILIRGPRKWRKENLLFTCSGIPYFIFDFIRYPLF